jgi:23S rRNA pseudouridine2605 synthase
LSVRLNKYLQQAGVGSRREAERLVEMGAVTVNGQTATVTTEANESDDIRVNGKPVAPANAPLPRIFRYHKPVGVIVTADDPEGRTTLYDALAALPEAETLPRLMPVGRLDLNSEGLLLLTTDGALAQTLMSPATALRRMYRVRVFGELNERQIAQFRKGVTISDTWYRGAEIALEKEGESGNNRWYTVTLQEGKNREIRRIFNHFGCEVNRLQRVQYGPFMLEGLGKGKLREVPAHEVEALMNQLKK